LWGLVVLFGGLKTTKLFSFFVLGLPLRRW
jgi:hypothetical protein